MKRFGVFSGSFYEKDFDFSNCPECYLVLSDSEAANEIYMSNLLAENVKRCAGCKGCPASQRKRRSRV